MEVLDQKMGQVMEHRARDNKCTGNGRATTLPFQLSQLQPEAGQKISVCSTVQLFNEDLKGFYFELSPEC
jgi:hypothetical protein